MKLVPPRRSTRLRAVRSSSTPAIKPALPEPLQEPSAAPQNQIALPPARGLKRRYLSEDIIPHKRLQEDLQSVSDFRQPLSEGNLDRHNRLTRSGTSDDMDTRSATPDRGGRKRSSSRTSSTVDTDQETVSVRSQASYTAARYRFNILRQAKIFVRPGAPPAEVQPRINAVIHREVSAERKRELSSIAENLCNDFLNILDGPSREDDCIEPIHRALSSMDSGREFDFRRKAGMAQPFCISTLNVMLTFLRLGPEP